MPRKLAATLLCSPFITSLAFAGASSTAAGPLIEFRQYITMTIVFGVCVAGGVWLFFKTSH
jgi:hypothetical protein